LCETGYNFWATNWKDARARHLHFPDYNAHDKLSEQIVEYHYWYVTLDQDRMLQTGDYPDPLQHDCELETEAFRPVWWDYSWIMPKFQLRVKSRIKFEQLRSEFWLLATVVACLEHQKAGYKEKQVLVPSTGHYGWKSVNTVGHI
jgi:hypothetical protein